MRKEADAAGIDGVGETKLMESFSKSVRCGVMRIDKKSAALHNVSSCGCACAIIEGSRIESGYCFGVHAYAGEQSERFGGKYIYFCPAGFVFVVCPVISGGGEARYLAAGPMSPVYSEDFDFEELAEAVKPNIPFEKISEAVREVPVVASDLISHMANLLHVCSRHLSEGRGLPKIEKNREIYEQQKQIGEYIQNVKAALIKESQSYMSYPYDKEKQLSYAIINSDLANSRKYINEILGHIFFSSANNLDVIKVRAMELSVMISRAALDGGADPSKIFDINIKFLSEFFNYGTIEEVCWSLTDILRKFTRETFAFSNVKHVDLISKAVSYVKSNYIRKLTLSEVAEYVFLSPSYFSKIFKEEMNYYFNDYLNFVRVEKSKVLLLTEKIGLVDVAEAVGFYDQSYFNKVFKKITGATPKKFKEQNGQIPPKEKPELKKNI
ncbi:MAG: PocR ligand-binding domain-containing protein [Oscillospiraceae bacterium]|nr:PocR ligand-binding domain-containing protein [Oscillospiraceae bacterium]